jgi:hypothetical protein
MLELAEILRRAGASYRASRALTDEQKRALRDIEDCRTPAMGGQVWRCDNDDCRTERYVYHSCGNRHCPKCHVDQTRRWIATRSKLLLGCSYFFFTFTVPRELHPLAKAQPRLIYGLLFRCAARAMLALCQDPRHLGARPGLIAVLHTWTRALLFHPHVHMIVTAGGAADQTWRALRNSAYLVPDYMLADVFRGKFRAALRRAGRLHQVDPNAWKKRWVVHGQHAGNGLKVLDYLARYAFRIALPNSRLVSFSDGTVCFGYTDNRSHEQKTCRLATHDFLDRFVQHVLPAGFTKIRYYGLFSPAAHGTREQIRAHFPPADTRAAELVGGLVCDPAPSAPLCPACHVGHLLPAERLPRIRAPDLAA